MVNSPSDDISIGDKAPAVVTTIVEIPKGSNVKYELDKDTGMLKLDRMLFSAVHYPGDYGFVPQTLCDDGDAIDVITITHNPVLPLTIADVRVLGVMKMLDSGEQDDKIVGVYDCDPRFKEMQDLKDVPEHIIAEIKEFFETYKRLRKKTVTITDVLGKEEAYKIIQESQKMYADKHSS